MGEGEGDGRLAGRRAPRGPTGIGRNPASSSIEMKGERAGAPAVRTTRKDAKSIRIFLRIAKRGRRFD